MATENPIEQYIAIIHNRQQNPLPVDVHGEKHHIIPKACGGSDVEWNVIRLTTLEHIRCHRLLKSIYADGPFHRSMCWAYKCLVTTRDGIELTEEEAAEARNGLCHGEETRVKISKARKGKPTRVGFHHSEETKQKNREAHLGKTHPGYTKGMHWHWSEESKQKVRGKPSNSLGYKHTEESRAKMREAAAKRTGPGPNAGKKMSEEQKRKISESVKAAKAKRRVA